MSNCKKFGITEAELTEALEPARMTKPDARMVGAGVGKPLLLLLFCRPYVIAAEHCHIAPYISNYVRHFRRRFDSLTHIQ